ncbi:C40 family peptidase [Georgenia sp. Z1344]|uniref:C40 family peptidase n=1 Tax=Georgenia sp. Z1344 TaxID=3416706 RepID=UPI003CE7299D
MRTTTRLTAATLTVLGAAVVTAPPAMSAAGGDIGGSGSEFHLSNSSSGQTAVTMQFGHPDGNAYVGDFNGNGVDTVAVRRGQEFAITTSNTTSPGHESIRYGRAGDEVFVGDWDGDGVDTFAVRRGNQFHIRNTVTSGVADQVIHYGRAGDEVVVGDWDGDGVDTIAVRRGNQYFLSNTLRSGYADAVVDYGQSDDQIIVGDWNGDSVDGLGVRRDNQYHLRNTLSNGVAEQVVSYGRTADTVMAGDWDGDRVDTLGVRRDTRVVEAPSRTEERETPPATDWIGDEVVATAMSYVGSPYRWAGTTPAGWDCIGFAHYVYAQHGIEIPRTTMWGAFANLEQVPASEARPGDLIWWPGHVAINLGDGQNVAAWNPSMGTRVGPNSWVGGEPTYFRVLPD